MSRHELVDLVDNNGEIVRTALPRQEAETLNGPELHLPIIGCVILNGSGQVLVHERAVGKRFAGCLDHVYGAMESRETPESATERECGEELGIQPQTMTRIREGINEYDYCQYLFVVVTDDVPQITSEREVAWVGHMTPEELKASQADQTRTFTHNFFIDLEAALSHQNNQATR